MVRLFALLTAGKGSRTGMYTEIFVSWILQLFAFWFFNFNFFLEKFFFTHDIYPHPHPRPKTSTHYPRPTTFSYTLFVEVYLETISGHAYIRKRCFSQNIQNNINAKGLRSRLLCFFSSRRGRIMLWGILASFWLNWWNVVCGQKAGLISIFAPCKGIPKQSWILDCTPVIENFRDWIPVFISAIPYSNR